MVAYAENRRAFSENSGAVPMELDAVKGKSKGKGKDKGGAAKKETRTCHVCQKVGHLAKDCWVKPQGKAQAKGKARAKGRLKSAF